MIHARAWLRPEIPAHGKPIYLTSDARGVGGQPAALAPGPDGSVILATQDGLYRIADNTRTLQPLAGGSTTDPAPSALSKALTASTAEAGNRTKETFYGGDGITAGPRGQVDSDAQPFIGLTFDAIVELSRTGRARVLWKS